MGTSIIVRELGVERLKLDRKIPVLDFTRQRPDCDLIVTETLRTLIEPCARSLTGCQRNK